MARILVIEANQNWKLLTSDALAANHRMSFCPAFEDAWKRLEKDSYDVIIADVAPSPEEETPKAILELKEKSPYTPLIVTSQTEKADFVVKTLRAGAYDFIVKPYTLNRIRIAVSQALEHRSLRNELDYLRRQQDITYDFDRIIAISPPMLKIIATLKKITSSDSTVLMTGETGTGKSILSGTVHFNSGRRSKPFVKINCANIPETLLESELFGHEKGAFTGANKTRAGRLEQANGGTVFLDEIGELSPTLQAKLLRVLEEKSFERLGGNQTIQTDIRIMAATNRILEELVEDGSFREDLYYRINVLRVHLPPLRERRQCIEPLSNYLLKKICGDLKIHLEGFAPEVLEIFKNHSWPGNIRELSNTIERAALFEDSYVITQESISLSKAPKRSQAVAPAPLKDLTASERELLLEALRMSNWIQKEAAERLAITPRKLNYMIQKHAITHERWRKNK
jgi:DNA-binding NtrC family response regulator